MRKHLQYGDASTRATDLPGYRDHLASRAWRLRRREAIERAGGKCERCGSTWRLTAHHKTYDRLGAELPEDLEVLCGACHINEHRETLDRAAMLAAQR